MKSLNFTVRGLFDKILTGEKTLTIRGLYVPTYKPGEIIELRDIRRNGKKKRILRRAQARVTQVDPIKLKDINDAIAEKEGFKNAEMSKEWLSEIYKCDDNPDRWFFVIQWRDVEPEITLDDFLEGNGENTESDA